jgi:O-antigen ligase
MALSALSSSQVRSTIVRIVLAAVGVLNVAALVLTFERSFFVAMVAGVILLIVKAPHRQRERLLVWSPIPFVAIVITLAVAAPTVLKAYEARLLSLGSYQTDSSVTYRVAESQLVSDQIAQHPVTGNAFGSFIMIGRPGTNVPIAPRRYAESGALWLAWKMGWPSAAVIWLLMILAAVWRSRRGDDPVYAAARLGAQASLAALAVVSISWNPFSQIAITPTMGVLIAICAAPIAVGVQGRRSIR